MRKDEGMVISASSSSSSSSSSFAAAFNSQNSISHCSMYMYNNVSFFLCVVGKYHYHHHCRSYYGASSVSYLLKFYTVMKQCFKHQFH